MRICPSFGNELNDNAVVCVKCGTKLSEKSEIKSSESLLLGFVKTLKIGLILFIVYCACSPVIPVFYRLVGFSDVSVLVGSFVSTLFNTFETIGFILMFIAVFQFSKYLSTKK